MTNMHRENSCCATEVVTKPFWYIFSASETFVMQMIPALHLGPCAAVNLFLVRVNIAIGNALKSWSSMDATIVNLLCGSCNSNQSLPMRMASTSHHWPIVFLACDIHPVPLFSLSFRVMEWFYQNSHVGSLEAELSCACLSWLAAVAWGGSKNP